MALVLNWTSHKQRHKYLKSKVLVDAYFIATTLKFIKPSEECGIWIKN